MALGLAISFCSSVSVYAGLIQSAEISARQIKRFKVGSDETRFGPLEFVGGLEMRSSNAHFGGLSGFRFVEPGSRFMAVADNGFILSGSVVRDDEGLPAGFADVELLSISQFEGRQNNYKWETDAEGMAYDNGRLLVSYEREHRITEYDTKGGSLDLTQIRNHEFLVPAYELRRNRGFETVAIAPEGNPSAGMMVVVTEKSIDKKGDIFAAVLKGPGRGIFKVKRRDEFDITDGAFLPDGNLLLLERSFSVGAGVKMRLRKIAAGDLRKGNRVDGEVLFSADLGYQIDNMEGLDVWKREDGSTMLSIISDDNKSLLQRNLYLEFRLVE